MIGLNVEEIASWLHEYTEAGKQAAERELQKLRMKQGEVTPNEVFATILSETNTQLAGFVIRVVVENNVQIEEDLIRLGVLQKPKD